MESIVLDSEFGMLNILTAFGQRFPQWKFVPVMMIVFAAGFMFGHQYTVISAQSSSALTPEIEEAFEPFWEVYNLIKTRYLDPVDDTTLVDGAINGMVEVLEDQYSGYMNPETFPMMNSDLSGEVEGIGAVVSTIEETGQIRIVNVLEGSPAQEAGILPGDIFVEVDGEDVTGLSQLELVGRVRGPAGTTVRITMLRGEERIEFEIVRARIIIPNTETATFGDIGYVKLNEFTSEARDNLDAAIESLNPEDLSGLILDLRGNPGGFLDSAVEVASAFIEEGNLILTEDFGERFDAVTFEANGDYLDLGIPIVVLVDETSASASELVTGAWQDYGVVTVIGEITFGKGTVQTWQELSNGGGIRLTIARWLRPSGDWIHGVGITPDIIVEWTPEHFEDFGNPETDPQLAAALEYLRDPDSFELSDIAEAEATSEPLP
jgi:carboxyl-terminal processing protease